MKKVFFVIIILLAFIVSGYSRKINNALTYNLGIVSYRKGNYTDALAKFRLVYRRTPQDFKTLYNIGNCHYKMRRYYLAIKWYLRARRLKPFDEDNLYNLTLAYVKTRRINSAIKTLTSLIKIDNSNAKLYYLAGSIYLHTGDFDKSIESFQTGVQLQSESATFERRGYKMLFYLHALKREYTLALNYGEMVSQFFTNDAFFNFNMGFVYKNAGNFEKAEFYYKRAIQINGKFKEAHINYLYTLNIQKKWKEIEKASLKAMKLFPNEFYFYVSRALGLYRTKKYKQCLKVMKNAYTINDKSVGALEFIGHLELTLGNFKKAIDYYEKVLVHYPSKVAILTNLVYLYAKTDNLVKGVLTIHLGLHHGADRLIYRYLAQLYLKTGDKKNAYQCYVKYLKKYPKGDYITFYNLARMYEENNKLKVAKEYYRKSIKSNYLFFNSHFNIALIYEKEQKFSKAISHYILCTNIYKSNFEPYYRIFYIYTLNDDFHIAVEYLEKAIKIGFRNVERIKEHFKYPALRRFGKFRRIMKKHFPKITL